MTLDEAVALLREAHSFVDPTDTDLFDRISAALAAHDAEPETVQWREYGGRDEDASIDGAHCILRYVGGSTAWHWDVTRTGTAQSLYDAREAAEKAARGVR
jgi:hypothetical protein